jgi:hypothetical protein
MGIGQVTAPCGAVTKPSGKVTLPHSNFPPSREKAGLDGCLLLRAVLFMSTCSPSAKALMGKESRRKHSRAAESVNKDRTQEMTKTERAYLEVFRRKPNLLLVIFFAIVFDFLLGHILRAPSRTMKEIKHTDAQY